MKERKSALILIISLFIVSWAISVFQVNTYQFPKVPKPEESASTDLSEKSIRIEEDLELQTINSITGRTNYREKELLVDASFTSNLPLIVIDTKGVKPRRGVVWDGEKEYYVPTGEDPYAYGEISVIDNADGQNRPIDNAKIHSLCKMRIRGNSSGNYDKEKYLIKLID